MRLRFIFPYNAYVGNQANYSNQWVSMGTYVLGRKIALCGDVIVDDGDTGWYPFGNWWDTGFGDLNILLRKGSNRTTRAMYRVRMIGRDTLLYLNQYSSSLSDTFQAPDGSVVIADGIKFQWSSSARYTGTSEEENRENLDVRFEGGRILVLVPKRGDFVYVEQTFEGKGVYFEVFKDKKDPT